MGAARWTMVPAIVPLAAVAAIDPHGYAPFGPAKWAAIGTLTLGSAGLGLWRRPARLERVTIRVWLALLAWAVGCTVGGLAHWEGVIGTAERHAGLLLWVLCALAYVVGQQVGDATTGAAGALVAGMLAGGAVLGGYGLIELWWKAPVTLGPGSPRLLGPFGSASALGAACTLFLPVAVGVWFERRLPVGWRMVGGTIALALLVVAVGSGTRGAWVGLGAALLYVTVSRRAELSRATRDLAVVIVLGVATVALAFALAPERSVTAALAREARPTSRLDEWRIATRVVAQHPLTGTGPEGYRIAFTRAVDDAYEQSYGRVVAPDRAHDAPLDVAATLGLPGLALYGALVLVVGRRVLRVARRGDLLAVGLGVGLLAYAVQSLFLFPLAELEPVVWLVAGLLVALDLGPSPLRSTFVRWPLPRIGAVLVGALSLVVAAAGLAELQADRHAQGAVSAGRAGRMLDALDQSRLAREGRPDMVRYRLIAAQALVLAGRQQAALDQLDMAARYSPLDPAVRLARAQMLATVDAWQDVVGHDPRNGSAWTQLGSVLADAGQSTPAEQAWLRAQSLAPHNVAPTLGLAQLYLDERRLDQAARALARARTTAPGDPRIDVLAAQLDAAGG